MTTEQIEILSIIFAAVVLFITEKWRYDIVALLALFASVAVGVVPTEEAFTGFSDPVVVTVAAVLVMSAAIGKSGVIDYALMLLSRFAESPKLQITVLAGMVMLLSAFINNVGALALLLPVAISFAKKANRPAAELLMPLSFGSLLGGLITMIGTPPNLLIANIRADHLGAPYQMFDFAPVGIGISAVGLIYLTFGWRLIPTHRPAAGSEEEQFTIEDYISEVRIEPDTDMVGKTIEQAEKIGDLTIVGVVRDGFRRLVPSTRMKLRGNDIMLVESTPQELESFIAKSKATLVGSEGDESGIALTSEDIGIVEAVVREESQLVGHNVRSIRLRSRFNVNLLAVHQGGQKINTRLYDVRFKSGDVIVLQGNLDAMPETLRELGCFPLAERNLKLGVKRSGFLPVLIMAGAVSLAVSNTLPVSIAFLGGMMAIALLKVLKLHEIYDAIDAPVLVLLGAMMPVTEAMQSTGTTDLMADLIISASTGLTGMGLIALFLIGSMLVTPFLNNAATVLLMAPIAISLAMKLELNPDPFLMAVAVGTSCDFLTPIGHQSNTLVMGPGGYKFGDYWRLGLPLSIIVIIVGTPLIMYFWPLH